MIDVPARISNINERRTNWGPKHLESCQDAAESSSELLALNNPHRGGNELRLHKPALRDVYVAGDPLDSFSRYETFKCHLFITSRSMSYIPLYDLDPE